MKNEILKCIYTRRSVRKYLNKKVPKDIINEIINAGIMAPSAMNQQPWRFSIVEGKDKINSFGKIAYNELINRKFPYIPSNSEYIFYDAPLLIVISGKRGEMFLKDDVNLAIENMFLAAHSLGLGSCWVGLAKFLDTHKDSRKELGIPNDFELVACLIFGYPAEVDTRIPKRKPKILKWIK